MEEGRLTLRSLDIFYRIISTLRLLWTSWDYCWWNIR